MSEPLVSVQMITYNHAPLIAQAIEGVLQQKTNFPFELVIGEDCSTDGTHEIVFEYQKKYPDIIQVITSGKNVGAKKNFYRTMKACRGNYVAFCEGDDYWHHPLKLQRQIDYLESHPECGLLFADYDFYHVNSRRLIKSYNCRKGFESPADLTTEDLLGSRRLMTLTAVIRRDLYEHVVEKDPYLHQSENFLMGDTQLWVEAALISKVSYIPESLATYRVLDESASHSKDQIKHLRFYKSNYEMRLYLFDKHKLFEDMRKEAEAILYNKTLQLAFYERNVELASEIRKKKPTFTWKEWFLYFGAKHFAIHYVCRGAIFFRNTFRKLQNRMSEDYSKAAGASIR
jgi:glycosyltransferase involved in cell wall biosynthesis